MKKVFPVLLVLLLAVSSSALAVRVGGDDFSSGWYSVTSSDGSFSASSVYLPEGCSLEFGDGVTIEPLQAKESVRPFTVGIGEWKCPEDIPAGVYSVKRANEKHSSSIEFYDEKMRSVMDIYLEERVINKINVKEGYLVVVEFGEARFESPIGIVFD